MDVEFGGSQELKALSARLQKMASRDLVVEELGKALDGQYPAIVKAVQKGAERLPKRGGLAARVAQTRIKRVVTVRKGFYSVKVTPDTNAVADPGAIDRGRVKHPTYGHEPSVIQLVPKGWFSEPLRALTPKIRAAIQGALDQAIRKV